MFDFFKKKKKNENKPQAVSPIQANSATSEPDGELAKIYTELLENHRNNKDALETNAETYVRKDNYDLKSEWLDALAICDIALENGQMTSTIQELYRQLYAPSQIKYVSMEYNDTDYRFWFQKNVEINDRFIQAGVIRGYCEQADLYNIARRGYRDLDKKIEYLRKGVELDDPASLGDYGYGVFHGFPEFGKADKEEGRRFIQRSKELGYEVAPTLEIYIDLYDDIDTPGLLEKIERTIEEMPKRKPYHVLADYYLRKNEMDKAVKTMKKGIETGLHSCEYLLGTCYLNGRIENADKEEGIRLLEKAFQYGVVYAANSLGNYYAFANDENTSLDKAIEWHEKAALYCFADSSLELAVIYLHNENYKDIPKGLQYLEQSIEDGSHRGLSQKAYLILETDILPDDPQKAKILLEKAMEMGNEYAPCRLGLAYQNAEFGGERDYQKALELFEIGAERQYLYSIELAGNYYRLGVGGEDETAQRKAVEYLSQARERDSNYARVELALCYQAGWGVEKDPQKAFDLFKEAADNNYPYAHIEMAVYFEEGILGEKDTTEAYNQYCIAAEAGIPSAIYHKGRYNKYAIGMPENPSEAMKLFHQAAEAGSPAGMVEVAIAYETEYGGTEFDAEKAIEYMIKAAEMDYLYAQYKLGYYYYFGLLETDVNKAVEWFNRAYQRGYPYAALMLGEIYLYNMLRKEETEYDKAFEYYKYAESQGVVSEGLGICYQYGLGVERSDTEAFKYYTLGANDQYVAAKYRLGLAYKYGQGTAPNLIEAYRWLSDAAQGGNIYAQYETAMMLLNGEGIEKDEAQAIQMLSKIAEENYNLAQFELGNCYLSGRGVPEDEMQAMYWYQRAADNGNEEAQKITGKRERRKR